MSTTFSKIKSYFEKNKKDIISNIIWLVGLIAALILIRQFVFTSVIVSGGSMDPTLQDRERVIALKRAKLKRFDIVTFPAPDDPSKNYIKRVIGLPGETVEYKDDTLYIDGKKMSEPYLDEFKGELQNGEFLTPDFTLEGLQSRFEQTGDVKFPLTDEGKIPEGKLFVMGDNRQISKDSRLIGYVNEKDISGDVRFSFWPPSKFGVIK